MARARSLASALIVLALVPVAGSEARDLSFDERVAAQIEIERVRYAHRVGATRSFEEAVPHDVIVDRVREYVAKSLALETVWNTPVTAEMLRLETQRIAASTRMPERLEELFAALDHDAFLIQETLVRQRLVERLARQRFAEDAGIHAEARAEAAAIRRMLVDGELDTHDAHPARSRARLIRRPDARQVDIVGHGEPAVEVPPAAFDAARRAAPTEVGDVGPVVDSGDSYAIHVAVEQDANSVDLVTYRIPRRSWDDWWAESAHRLDPDHLQAVAGMDATLPAANGDAECTGDTWRPSSALNPMPDRREEHTAIWTGSEMIIWGGTRSAVGEETSATVSTGLKYDPATDSWSHISDVGAPSARTGHMAVWTGSEMIVWGEKPASGDEATMTGGRYDPLTDTWTPTSLAGVPRGTYDGAAVWTGSEAIFWGGIAPNGVTRRGARYDPDTDTWTSTTITGAPVARYGHVAVWTGDEMIVWGGLTSPSQTLNSGGRYDPVTDSWTPTSTVGVPLARVDHTAVWTGAEMIVWGGRDSAGISVASGGRYDPGADTWMPTTNVDAPSARRLHAAVWTGDEMIVWGDLATQNGGSTATGGRYDPVTDSWTATSELGAPTGRSRTTVVWTGDEAIFWGGRTTYLSDSIVEIQSSGGRYDPATDSWTPTFRNFAPPVRQEHAAVWTGNEMIVWGGGTFWHPDGSGGRYDPVTDDWTPTSTSSAPDARLRFIAVWTGTEMMIWGGVRLGNWDDTNGRYDLLTDTWTPISTVGEPSRRSWHAGVWTGDEMIVWSGLYNTDELEDGARYDPATDSWSPMNVTGAPEPRHSMAYVWAGDRMIVWGGFGDFDELGTGGAYDPVTDSWTPTSSVDAPSPRANPTAVWAGTEVIVWGDFYGLESGGRYDPAADTWTPTSVESAPSLGRHTAVWTGNRMIVWGGNQDAGGRYDPVADNWEATSTDGAPVTRIYHTAVWTGAEMIVWGGIGPWVRSDGGAYDPAGADVDGDSFGCALDCDDSDPFVFAAPGEVQGLAFADRTEVRWLSSAAATGSSTTYDLVRGVAPELPVGSGASELCLASGWTSPDDGFIRYDDPFEPAQGQTVFYVVRATNSCGTGGYGLASDGQVRVTGVCP